jgi:hypothetical protein
MELNFSQQVFEKSSNIKFHEIYLVGAELLFHAEGYIDKQTDGQADRQTGRYKGR